VSGRLILRAVFEYGKEQPTKEGRAKLTAFLNPVLFVSLSLIVRVLYAYKENL